MKTGVSGATALSSSIVGSRFSANWCSVKPPTTRTHCGGGVTATCRFSMRHGVGEAAHAVPAQLHVVVQPAADDVQVVVDQARHDAPALEVDRPWSSDLPAPSPRLSAPTARKRPSRIATAVASGARGRAS